MATKKKEVQVRDLKPSKDAKGGVARQSSTRQSSSHGPAGGGTHGSNKQKGPFIPTH